MTDSVHLLGNGTTLIGVLSRPSSDLNGKVAVIFFNSGLLHRVGPFRLYVDLSRRFAEQGLASLRIDQSGKGDSQRRQGISFEQTVKRDFEEAAAFLKSTVGATEFIVVGLCSGADDGLYLGSQYPEIVGAVLLEPYAARTPKFYRRHYAPRLLRISSWAAWIGRVARSLHKRAFSRSGKALDAVDMGALRSFPGHDEMRRRFLTAVERRARLLCIFTSGSTRYYNYAGQLAEGLGLKDRAGLISEIHLPWAKHTYPLVSHRQQLIDHVCGWIRSNFPVVREQELRPVDAAVESCD
jgi:pimeloyl-ACP methyl ester carboxylesterase